MTSDTAPWLLRQLATTFAMGDWVDEALCAQTDPELYFPEKGGSVQPAKKTCARCPVIDACRDYAVRYPTRLEGIWGGLSELERRPERAALGLPNAARQTDNGLFGCGTPAGYKAHYRRDEQPCESCRRAELSRRRR